MITKKKNLRQLITLVGGKWIQGFFDDNLTDDGWWQISCLSRNGRGPDEVVAGFGTNVEIPEEKKVMEIDALFGSGEQLTPLQMAARSFCMFFILLALIRIGGMRIFGKKTAFDSILVIMLGSVLARGVVGASPFLSTIAAAAIMVVIHRILGLLAMRYTWVGKIVKGVRHSLYKDGTMNAPNMTKSAISEDDLRESVRLEINSDTIDEAKEIFIEKNGHVSVVKKNEEE